MTIFEVSQNASVCARLVPPFFLVKNTCEICDIHTYICVKLVPEVLCAIQPVVFFVHTVVLIYLVSIVDDGQ